jgi:hypothetical protein
MLPLSEELLEIIQPETEKPEDILNIPCGILKLYASLGGVSDRLIDTGFLNFILTDKDGTLLGYPIKEIENTPIVVESMEGIKPNAHKGLPCGNEGFIRKLSDKVGRDLSFKKESDLEKGGVLIIHFTQVSILLEY